MDLVIGPVSPVLGRLSVPFDVAKTLTPSSIYYICPQRRPTALPGVYIHRRFSDKPDPNPARRLDLGALASYPNRLADSSLWIRRDGRFLAMGLWLVPA